MELNSREPQDEPKAKRRKSSKEEVHAEKLVPTMLFLFILLLVVGFIRTVQTMISAESLQASARAATAKPARRGGELSPGVLAALHMMRTSRNKYVVVDAKNGLGNRLRALASAMSVAHELRRPLLLIWQADLHCNCSFGRMFATPLPFAVLEEEMPCANLTSAEFQTYNYMRPEVGAIKDELIEPDPSRHLYFKSAFIMNHPHGGWTNAQRHIQRLKPVEQVREKLVADKGMIGLHVRNIFDAPRDSSTARSTLGREALQEAQKEYGKEGTRQLVQWRKASHWTNFVPRIVTLLREYAYGHPQGLAREPLQFYLAADSQEAYRGLSSRFPSRMLSTTRSCTTERCDFRDCVGMQYSLIDMMNLARTRLILGSGWSSYSEVAAFLGGEEGKPVPMLMAGRDFGLLIDSTGRRSTQARASSPNFDFVLKLGDAFDAEVDGMDRFANNGLGFVHMNWPKPFE